MRLTAGRPIIGMKAWSVSGQKNWVEIFCCIRKRFAETHLCLIYRGDQLGGVEHTFRLLRRQKISRLRAAVEELVGGAEGSPFLVRCLLLRRLLSSDDTPTPCVWHSCRYTFIGAPTYTFESLQIQPGFRLHYKGQEVDPTDTPEKLRALNKSGILTAQLRYTYGVETALGPEDTDMRGAGPWREWTPPPGSVQVTPRYETRLRSGND
ncbi:hypothetical protein B0H10DRAFT_2072362 [Mycena sp. CBHHK59/15]|nr:hypothetical protein B0H10DRAFT_2072362 [Mycena sp. CBHHK59/15]